METFAYPQWPTTSDEQHNVGQAGFDQCEAALKIICEKGGWAVSDKQYSISKKWGKILRAKLSTTSPGLSVVSQITCWASSNKGVELYVEFEGCGPLQAGC